MCSSDLENYGSVQAKIPTEVLITDRREYELSENGFITLTLRRDSNNAAFFSANSALKPKIFPNTPEGKQAETNFRLGTQLPYIFLISRLAHYLKVLLQSLVASVQVINSMHAASSVCGKGRQHQSRAGAQIGSHHVRGVYLATTDRKSVV